MNTSEELKRTWIDCLLEEKSYEELSSSERAIVNEEVGSKEAYENLQKVNAGLLNLTDEKTPEPNPETLLHLKGTFQKAQEKKHKKPSILLKKWSIPSYQLAAAAAILIALFIFVTPTNKPATIVQLREVTTVDTLYVTSPPDTVFVDRFITKVVREPVYISDETSDPENLSQLESAELQEYMKLINDRRGYSLDEREYLLTLNVEME